jgi:hypothetical protein
MVVIGFLEGKIYHPFGGYFYYIFGIGMILFGGLFSD